MKNQVTTPFSHCRDKSIMRSSSSATNDWRSRRSGRNRNYSARTCIPSHFSYRIRRSNFRSRFEITELLIRGSRNYSAGSRMTHAHVRNLQRDRRFHHVLKPHNLLSRLCVLRTPSLWTTVRATISVEECKGHARTYTRTRTCTHTTTTHAHTPPPPPTHPSSHTHTRTHTHAHTHTHTHARTHTHTHALDGAH